MTNKILTIEPGKSPMQAARLMVKHDIGRLPVVDDGKLLGLITEHDLIVVSSHLLERYLEENS